MKNVITLLIACILSSSTFANLNGYLASSGTSKGSLEQVEYSTYGAYLHFDKLPEVLFLVDDIKDGDIFDLRRALRKHPSISAVVLDSKGGLVSEALLIAGVISDRGLTTYIPKDALCASACSFIYFAGKSRLVEGALGVHQFSNSDDSKRDNVSEVQQDTQYTTSEIISFLNAFNTPSFVYEEMFASSNMYFFTKEERARLSSHESLALLTSVDSFIEDLNKESELQNENRHVSSIKSLQTELKRVGCYAGPVDGVRGSGTEQALDMYLKRKARSLDWSADALAKITKYLRKEVGVACVEEYTVSTPKVPTPKVPTPKVPTPKVVYNPNLESDKAAYKHAFGLIRERFYPEAIEAMEKFIAERPKSDLLGNAHYWLGELFMVQGQADKALASFEQVVNMQPAHRKQADAMYKMGVAYSQSGQLINSKNMFRQVITYFPNTEAAKLSKERLPSYTVTSSNRYNDQLIETSTVDSILRAYPLLETTHVRAASFHGIVLLLGQVPSEDIKIVAGAKARKISNVRKVHNELIISSPSSYTVRTSDSAITFKVKSRMAGETAFPAGRIKVVTENGVVYLMGRVTKQEGAWAVTVTVKASGIQRVVKVFEYID